MQAELQEEIDIACKKLGISTAKFRPLPFTTDWHRLEERIYQKFCKISGKSRPIWLWEYFKEANLQVSLTINPYLILNQFVEPTEVVWFMASDGDKFFFYEGKAIQAIVGETTGVLDEYYLISKKYAWLISVNHHDNLVGVGATVIKKIRDFIQRSPTLITSTYPA